jgi:integrase
MLAERTLSEYRWYVRRWTQDGQPEPQAWVQDLPGFHARRNASAALVWWYRTELGESLKLERVPAVRKVPEAFSERQLHRVLEASRVVHRRAEPTFELLYSTGARISEATGIYVDDITDTHIILRNTKRNARTGMRTERAIPLSARSSAAVAMLRALPPGRLNNLLGCRAHLVQDWCRTLSVGLGFHVHPHKFRATFCTHLLQRGVPLHEVQRLMGHGDIATCIIGRTYSRGHLGSGGGATRSTTIIRCTPDGISTASRSSRTSGGGGAGGGGFTYQ